jgi:serine/threonine protein kinase
MGDNPSWDFTEGDEIAPGRTVLKPLGGGTRYEVMLVWDDHRFAIMVAKVLRPHVAQGERYLRELAEEADALSTLAHPVMVRGFDAIVEGQYPHLLIEHLEGPTLRRLIRRGGPLPMQQLLPLALHVSAALHYMAAEGWVHLDIKPDNLVMGLPPRVIDLSIARTFERAARSRGPLGTDAYMAPEQCGVDGTAPMGPAADVYGLCATLWHAATGAVPFPREKGAGESPDPEVRFPQLWAPPPEPTRQIHPALADLLLAGLDRDPAARPSAGGLATALEPMVGELPRKIPLSRRGR